MIFCTEIYFELITYCRNCQNSETFNFNQMWIDGESSYGV